MRIIIFFILQYPIDRQFIYLSDLLLINKTNLQGLTKKKPSIMEGFLFLFVLGLRFFLYNGFHRYIFNLAFKPGNNIQIHKGPFFVWMVLKNLKLSVQFYKGIAQFMRINMAQVFQKSDKFLLNEMQFIHLD